MKEWWNVTDKDAKEMLAKTKWSPANRGYFRGGGFSSVYNVMANWGANHGAFVYGHIGKDLIRRTLQIKLKDIALN